LATEPPLNDTDQSRSGPTIIPRADHNISRANISPNALKVLYRLKSAGYEAFLVGGSVRDLLLGKHPKDFDVATNARPEEMRQLFRNCRLIGRRFRLAHVRFGREVVEVATFRGMGTEGDDERVHSESGRILRDNVYGSIDEDVWRRDFTANALYYNIADFSVWDYVGGMDDIRSRTLRLIGDPETRYREDPVRMLRAVRFAAKLDFTLAPETAAPLVPLGHHLAHVPPARLFDEILKLFQAGFAVRSFELLLEHDLFRYLFASTQQSLEGPDGAAALEFIKRGLANTDDRVHAEKPVTPMFLFAVFLWFPIKELAERLRAEGRGDVEAMLEASQRIVAAQQAQSALPKRFGEPMKEMLAMQYRFLEQRGPRAAKLLAHKRFRAAYDFLLLRARCGEVDEAIAEFWTEVQAMTPEEQRKAFGLKRPRRRRRRSHEHRASADAAP